MVTFVLLHAFSKDGKNIEKLASITHLPSLSLSTSYLEPRFRIYNQELRLYPKMKSFDFLGSVYE